MRDHAEFYLTLWVPVGLLTGCNEIKPDKAANTLAYRSKQNRNKVANKRGGV